MLTSKYTIFWEYNLNKKIKQPLEDYFTEIKKILLNDKVVDIQIIFWEEQKRAYGNIRFLNPAFNIERFVKNNPKFSFFSEVEELGIIKDKKKRDFIICRNWELGNSNLRKDINKLLTFI